MNALLSRAVLVAAMILTGCSQAQQGEWKTPIVSGQPQWVETGDNATVVFTGNQTPWGNTQFHLVTANGAWPLFLNEGSCVVIERRHSTTQTLCLKDKQAIYSVDKD